MNIEEKKELEVFGATIHGFAQACINLNIVAGTKASNLTRNIEVNRWYPFEHLKECERIVFKHYENPKPILEKVGAEMMFSWYSFGPGKEIIKRGVDFLHFQSGSEGYASVVRGPEEVVGNFNLMEIDEKEGKALIYSTTPFDKNLERGVIIGGMSAPGDLSYINVDNDEDVQRFRIEFH